MNQPENLAELVADLSRPRGPGILIGRLLDHPRWGGPAARLLRRPLQVRWLATRITRLHARLLRITRGRMRRSWLFAAGQPVLALTTTGRRSGASQTTTVAALCQDGTLATVGMNLGLERQPGWAYNLGANPQAVIEVGGRAVPVTARRAVGDERDELWSRWLYVQPSARAMAELAGREVPIFVLEPRD